VPVEVEVLGGAKNVDNAGQFQKAIDATNVNRRSEECKMEAMAQENLELRRRLAMLEATLTRSSVPAHQGLDGQREHENMRRRLQHMDPAATANNVDQPSSLPKFRETTHMPPFHASDECGVPSSPQVTGELRATERTSLASAPRPLFGRSESPPKWSPTPPTDATLSDCSGLSLSSSSTPLAPRSAASATLPEKQHSDGTNADREARVVERYDETLENDAVRWIEMLTGACVAGRVHEALRTGQVLCNLVNRVRPETIVKVNDAGRPFKERENIGSFLKACRELGVQEYALFSTDDLYDARNLLSVMRCIHALGGAVQRSVPEFSGPRLGVVDISKAKRDLKRDLGFATQTGGLQVAMERCHIDVTSTSIVRGARGGC
jgi:hypothetical protein